MKRSSNRLVLLVGIFLAVVAFVLIAVMFSGGSIGNANASPSAAAKVNVVVAAKNLPLGSKITADAVTTKAIDASTKPGDSYTDVAFVIGQTVRQPVTAGQLITSTVINGGGTINNIVVPPGYVGIAVQVDQVTGVGTLIKPGDRVDVVTGFANIPEVTYVGGSTGSGPTPTPRGSAAPSGSPGLTIKGVDAQFNPNSVKTVVEGLSVLGTLLPPPASAASPGASSQGGTSLNGQQQIVILAATSQQAEAIRYAQVDGTIALVLRSAADCQATDGTATPCPIIPTTGITLRRMVDDFGVLPPQVIEVLMPTPYPSPMPSRLYPSPSPDPNASPSASTKP